MNSYGIIKKIDQLGRITVPKTFREQLGVDIGSPLEICRIDGGILLKPLVDATSEIEETEESESESEATNVIE